MWITSVVETCDVRQRVYQLTYPSQYGDIEENVKDSGDQSGKGLQLLSDALDVYMFVPARQSTTL